MPTSTATGPNANGNSTCKTICQIVFWAMWQIALRPLPVKNNRHFYRPPGKFRPHQ
jgi:hypothetical protein